MVSDLAVAILTLVGGGLCLLKNCLNRLRQKDELEEHQTAYDGRKQQQANDKEPAHQPHRPLVRLVAQSACPKAWVQSRYSCHALSAVTDCPEFGDSSPSR